MNIRQMLAQRFYSPGAYGLWLALDDAENWMLDEHTATYKRSPPNPNTFRDKPPVCAMWIANGASHFDGYPSMGTPKFLGWYERRWLWKKFKTIRNRQMLYRFTRLEEPK